MEHRYPNCDVQPAAGLADQAITYIKKDGHWEEIGTRTNIQDRITGIIQLLSTRYHPWSSHIADVIIQWMEEMTTIYISEYNRHELVWLDECYAQLASIISASSPEYTNIYDPPLHDTTTNFPLMELDTDAGVYATPALVVDNMTAQVATVPGSPASYEELEIQFTSARLARTELNTNLLHEFDMAASEEEVANALMMLDRLSNLSYEELRSHWYTITSEIERQQLREQCRWDCIGCCCCNRQALEDFVYHYHHTIQH